jgi:hypothetical protein
MDASLKRGDATLREVKPEDLHSVWPLILEGLYKVEKHSESHWIPEDVYTAIRTGHSTLHVGYIDCVYVGFFVLTKSTAWDGSVLHIWCGYTNHPDGMELFMPKLEALAIGCRRITFWSPRKWKRRIKQYGFVEKQVEYVREL